MTQKQKDLLLKDLCARLPYEVKAKIKYYDDAWRLCSINPNGYTIVARDIGYPMETDWVYCKPYLFPMSSMTEEQNLEYLRTCKGGNADVPTLASFDYLYKNHIDIRGLIPMGLAEDATSKNIY